MAHAETASQAIQAEQQDAQAHNVTVATKDWFTFALGAAGAIAAPYLLNYAAHTLPIAMATMNPVQWALTIGAGVSGAALGYLGAGRGSSGERTINLASAAASVITPIYAPQWGPISSFIHKASSWIGLRHLI